MGVEASEEGYTVGPAADPYWSTRQGWKQAAKVLIIGLRVVVASRNRTAQALHSILDLVTTYRAMYAAVRRMGRGLMPIHDWTQVSAGTFHSFHNAWITHLQAALNMDLLPQPYYALGEQQAGAVGPDVLTLKGPEAVQAASEVYAVDPLASSATVLSTLDAPPRVHATQVSDDETAFYLSRQRRLAIRHASGDRVIAIVEIVSKSHRHTRLALEQFADKVIGALQTGVHVVLIDLYPHGMYDPHGLHDYLWQRMMAGSYQPEAHLPLTLVSYTAGQPIQAWIEPIAVGVTLTPMPLFLTREHYILLPLEQTYMQAWQGMPARWQEVITQPPM